MRDGYLAQPLPVFKAGRAFGRPGWGDPKRQQFNSGRSATELDATPDQLEELPSTPRAQGEVERAPLDRAARSCAPPQGSDRQIYVRSGLRTRQEMRPRLMRLKISLANSIFRFNQLIKSYDHLSSRTRY
jgi:hypothetical protein